MKIIIVSCFVSLTIAQGVGNYRSENGAVGNSRSENGVVGNSRSENGVVGRSQGNVQEASQGQEVQPGPGGLDGFPSYQQGVQQNGFSQKPQKSSQEDKGDTQNQEVQPGPGGLDGFPSYQKNTQQGQLRSSRALNNQDLNKPLGTQNGFTEKPSGSRTNFGNMNGVFKENRTRPGNSLYQIKNTGALGENRQL